MYVYEYMCQHMLPSWFGHYVLLLVVWDSSILVTCFALRCVFVGMSAWLFGSAVKHFAQVRSGPSDALFILFEHELHWVRDMGWAPEWPKRCFCVVIGSCSAEQVSGESWRVFFCGSQIQREHYNAKFRHACSSPGSKWFSWKTCRKPCQPVRLECPSGNAWKSASQPQSAGNEGFVHQAAWQESWQGIPSSKCWHSGLAFSPSSCLLDCLAHGPMTFWICMFAFLKLFQWKGESGYAVCFFLTEWCLTLRRLRLWKLSRWQMVIQATSPTRIWQRHHMA